MHPTLYSLQALRAVAAAAVVCYHVLYMLAHSAGYAFTESSLGAAGVDLFFVISGFVMVYTQQGQFGGAGAPQEFLVRRLIRIAPIYWLYTTLLALLLAGAPALFGTTVFDGQHVAASYLFLLSKNSAGHIGTVLQTGWTLCYEMYFYAVFALLLTLPRRWFLPLCATLFLMGVYAGEAAMQRDLALPAWLTVATNTLLLEFLLGACVAFAFLRGWLLPPMLAWSAMVGALATVALSTEAEWGLWTRVLCLGVPGAALVWGAVSLERAQWRTPRWLVTLGDSSYSLYLVHPFVIALFGKVWAKLGLAASVPASMAFVPAFVAAVWAGHLAWRWIEQPVTHRLQAAWARRSAQRRPLPTVDSA